MMDICVTVISEETFDAPSAQSERCRSFACASQVSQAEQTVKKEVRWTLNMENLGTMLLCLLL